MVMMSQQSQQFALQARKHFFSAKTFYFCSEKIVFPLVAQPAAAAGS